MDDDKADTCEICGCELDDDTRDEFCPTVCAECANDPANYDD